MYRHAALPTIGGIVLHDRRDMMTAVSWFLHTLHRGVFARDGDGSFIQLCALGRCTPLFEVVRWRTCVSSFDDPSR